MKIKYGYLPNKFILLFYLLFLLFSFYVYSLKWPYASIFDFEGFDTTVMSIIFFIFLIVNWFYQRYAFDILTIENDGFRIIGQDNNLLRYDEIAYVEQSNKRISIHTKNSNSPIISHNMFNHQKLKKFLVDTYDVVWIDRSRKKWVNYIYLFLWIGLILGYIIISKDKFNLKYYLPLKKIETTQIEVTLKRDATIRKYGSSMLRTKFGFSNQDEYPEISFHYGSEFKGLREKFCNVEFEQVESRTNRNKEYKVFDHVIEKGTKVKIRVRQNQLEDALTLDYQELSNYEQRKINEVRIYELAIGDSILLQKHGLKL